MNIFRLWFAFYIQCKTFKHVLWGRGHSDYYSWVSLVSVLFTAFYFYHSTNFNMFFFPFVVFFKLPVNRKTIFNEFSWSLNPTKQQPLIQKEMLVSTLSAFYIMQAFCAPAELYSRYVSLCFLKHLHLKIRKLLKGPILTTSTCSQKFATAFHH